MNKKLTFGAQAQEKLAEGANELANAVKGTLGAKGRLVVINKVGYPPLVTKDGWTVADEIRFGDNAKDMGAMLLKQAAAKSVEDNGDGTTTATVLAQYMLNAGIKHVNDGANSVLIKKGIDLAVSEVVEKLKEQAIPVKGDMVKKVATVSANGDEEMGELIYKAVEAAGDTGLVKVENSGTTESTISIKSGATYDSGWLSPYFINNPNGTAEYENACVIIVGQKIKKFKEFLPVMNEAASTGMPILLIADDYEMEVSSNLILNRTKNQVPIVLVKSPLFSEKLQVLEDIAYLTGATVISDVKGIDFKHVKKTMFGIAEKVVVSQKSFTIINGNGKNIAEREQALRLQIEDAENKTELSARLTKLVGKVAVVSIGGAAEAEIKEKRDRADDAIGAAYAAIAEGVVAGGGLTLAKMATGINILNDVDLGKKIVYNALSSPLMTILENAGEPHLFEEVLEKGGYNVMTGEFGDMIEMGILDPVKVTRCALQNAASVVGLMLTTHCVMELETNYNYAGK